MRNYGLSFSLLQKVVMTKTICFFLLGLWAGLADIQAQSGLLGEYYDGTNFETKKMTRHDNALNFYWNRGQSPGNGIRSDQFSVRWTGQIKAPKSGNYLFRAKVDDGLRVKINGQMVINAWEMNDHIRTYGNIQLQAGQTYPIVVEYFNGLFEGELQLFWQLPGNEPTFGGLLGYNDQLIASEYFIPAAQPVAAVAPVKPQPAKKTTSPTKTPVKTPAPKTETTAKPAPPQPKPVPLAKDSIARYVPKNVLFEQSKSIILEESWPALNDFAGYLLRHTTIKVSIEGHTDIHGDSAKNMQLSEERAAKVADYLVKKGVHRQRITTKGYGDTRPIVRQKTKTSHVQNRRVEFILSE